MAARGRTDFPDRVALVLSAHAWAPGLHRAGSHTVGLPHGIAVLHGRLLHFVVAAGRARLDALAQLVGESGAGATTSVSWQAAPIRGGWLPSGTATPPRRSGQGSTGASTAAIRAAASRSATRGPYRVRKPSARLTCHMWPSGSAKAPAYPHFWFPASMTILAPASCADASACRLRHRWPARSRPDTHAQPAAIVCDHRSPTRSRARNQHHTQSDADLELQGLG